jgi:hypothetical protein
MTWPARCGGVGQGLDRRGRRGATWPGEVGCGRKAWQAWPGPVWYGAVGQGAAGQARRGTARFGAAWYGKAGTVGLGGVR